MKRSQIARVEKLETNLKAFYKQTLWVDLVDNRVRIDLIGNQLTRGEEVTFDSVYDCLTWVDQQVAQFEKVTGVAYIDDIAQTFAEGFPREFFNRIHEGAAYKNIVIGLNELHGKPIGGVAFVTWWHFISRDEKWKKEVERRIDLFAQYLADEDDEQEDVETE